MNEGCNYHQHLSNYLQILLLSNLLVKLNNADRSGYSKKKKLERWQTFLDESFEEFWFQKFWNWEISDSIKNMILKTVCYTSRYLWNIRNDDSDLILKIWLTQRNELS